jgi:hypothetical protein
LRTGVDLGLRGGRLRDIQMAGDDEMQKTKPGIARFIRVVIALPFIIVGEVCRALWKVCESIESAITGDKW